MQLALALDRHGSGLRTQQDHWSGPVMQDMQGRYIPVRPPGPSRFYFMNSIYLWPTGSYRRSTGHFITRRVIHGTVRTSITPTITPCTHIPVLPCISLRLRRPIHGCCCTATVRCHARPCARRAIIHRNSSLLTSIYCSALETLFGSLDKK